MTTNTETPEAKTSTVSRTYELPLDGEILNAGLSKEQKSTLSSKLAKDNPDVKLSDYEHRITRERIGRSVTVRVSATAKK